MLTRINANGTGRHVPLQRLKGQLECLKYAHENGCEWRLETCFNAVMNGHFECLKYEVLPSTSPAPSLLSPLPSLPLPFHSFFFRYANENGCEWSVEICNTAAHKGRLDCLMYMTLLPSLPLPLSPSPPRPLTLSQICTREWVSME